VRRQVYGHRFIPGQGKFSCCIFGAFLQTAGAVETQLLVCPGGLGWVLQYPAEEKKYKVLGQKFPYTQVQLPMMPSLNLLDPHNHNLESLSSWHTSCLAPAVVKCT